MYKRQYKGVSFTPAGRETVHTILRNRRLWEVFFVQQLNFTPSEADALACRMEHITHPEVAARLSEFLGHPATSPTGLPIPNGEHHAHHSGAGISLPELPTGVQAEVLSFGLDDAASAYLRSENLIPGTVVEVLAVSSNGAVLVAFGQQRLSLSREMAARIIVSPTQERQQYVV